ncbi:MAG: RNA polymerase sigma factor [Planctomycetota bacterium]|jgi:RNA polymerase sigma-70 factor (ECF subfamily)
MKKDFSNIEDQLLVMDAQDGDAEAMEALVGRWQKRLWQHVFRLTADRQAAWDITQESWIGIIKGLRKLHDPANFRAWAYRIATNKAFDWIKKRRTGKRIRVEDIQDHRQQEKKDMGVMELMEKLDMKKRAVLNLYYFEQLSVFEISVALDIPAGTVKSRLHTARKELKKLWQDSIEK